MSIDNRRVVVTGLSVISPLGELPLFWESLQSGHSGIRKISSFDADSLNCQVAGEVDFDPSKYGISIKQVSRLSRASLLATAATRSALMDAALSEADLAREGDRIGVSLGTANAGFEVLLAEVLRNRLEGKRMRPTALINGLPNMPAHYVSADVGATGPLYTVSAACASGTQSIGVACDLIRNGRADIVISGGVDCLVHEAVMKGFEGMGILSTGFNDTPSAASRPFDAQRNGFVMSEGVGILILESLEHALQRSAHIYAEVIGHSSSSDAFHSAAPDAEGVGAANAMHWALKDAALSPKEVDYINAHGTGTKINDIVETLAIKNVFGDYAYGTPISSTKSMLGHSMGASGALEAIVCILSITDRIVHPTINLTNMDPECDLDYVPNIARRAHIQVALSNSFGLGGQNACILFRQFA